MPSSMVFLQTPSPSSSASRLQLFVWCIDLANPTISHQYYMTYTGFQCRSESFSRFCRWLTKPCAAWRRSISQTWWGPMCLHRHRVCMSMVPATSLRSATDNLLSVPTSSSRSFGDRRFPYAAPSLWNDLPLEVGNAPILTKFESLF